MQKKMDYEPLLTILFALGIAAALIAYAAFPRGRSAAVSMAHSASVGSFAPANLVPAVQTTEVAAVEPVAVEASPTSQTPSVVDVTPVAADAVGPVEVAVQTPVASAIEVPAAASQAKPRRSTRKKSAATPTTKTRARRSSRKASTQ